MSWFKTPSEKRLLALVAEKKALEASIISNTNERLRQRTKALADQVAYEEVSAKLKEEFGYIR